MPGTIIKTKYSDITNQPAPDALAHSEQAYSFASNRLFIGKTSGATVDPIIIGGKYYTDMMAQTPGVLTASSTIIVDQYMSSSRAWPMLRCSSMIALLSNG